MAIFHDGTSAVFDTGAAVRGAFAATISASFNAGLVLGGGGAVSFSAAWAGTATRLRGLVDVVQDDAGNPVANAPSFEWWYYEAFTATPVDDHTGASGTATTDAAGNIQAGASGAVILPNVSLAAGPNANGGLVIKLADGRVAVSQPDLQ